MQLKIHRQIESLITAEIGLLIAAAGDEIDRPSHVHTEGGKDSVHGIHMCDHAISLNQRDVQRLVLGPMFGPLLM